MIDVQGVGYRVAIPLSTFYRLGDRAARRSCSCTPTCARTPSPSTASSPRRSNRSSSACSTSREWGRRSPSGSSPASRPPTSWTRCAAATSLRLTRIPGVGKKTAERLVLELRDKMPPPGAPAATRDEDDPHAGRPPLRPRPPRLLAPRGGARCGPGAEGGRRRAVRGPAAAQPPGTLRAVRHRDRPPPRLRPAPGRRPGLRRLPAASSPRRVRGPAPGGGQPARGHRSGAHPGRGPRSRPPLRPPGSGQDQPRPRHRRRAGGAREGHRGTRSSRGRATWPRS